MPEMGGSQVFEKILSVSPETKILLTSGHPRSATVDAMIRRGASGFLQKPFEVEDLRAVIEKVLSDPTSA